MKAAKERAFPTWCGESNVWWLQNSFLFPDSAATVSFVVLGRALRLHVTSKPHKKQIRGKCCHELDEGCFNYIYLGWCATRGQRRDDDAQPQPASWFEGARAPHVMNIPFERAHQGSDIYGHIQTKLTFICGSSLNTPSPPPPPQSVRARPPFAKSSIVSSSINFCWDHLLILVFSKFSLTTRTSPSCALFLSLVYKCITLFFLILHMFSLFLIKIRLTNWRTSIPSEYVLRFKASLSFK